MNTFWTIYALLVISGAGVAIIMWAYDKRS